MWSHTDTHTDTRAPTQYMRVNTFTLKAQDGESPTVRRRSGEKKTLMPGTLPSFL